MKSWKNQLQEKCQKEFLKFPIYNTYKINKSDHEPLWQSEVDFNGEKFKGLATTKKDAENKAAQEACEDVDIIVKPISDTGLKI